VLIGRQLAISGQFGMDDRDGATYVADLVTQRAHQNFGTGEDLPQVELGAVAQLLGGIEDNSGKTRAGRSLVSRKPDMGQETFADLPASPALHFRVKTRRFPHGWRDTRQGRKELVDGLPLQPARLDSEQTVCSRIC